MRDGTTSRYYLSRRGVAYVLAVVLPVLGTLLTWYIPGLHALPYALHFLAVVFVGSLGGLPPALLTVALAVFTRMGLGAALPQSATPIHLEIPRALVLTAAALLVWLMNWSRLRSERKLGAALAALQERSDTLAETLNSSQCASWTIDLDSGMSARWHAGSYPVFGRPFAELEPLPSLRPLLHPEDQPRLDGLVELMRSTSETVVFEHRVPWPNGDLHWLEMRGTRVSGRPCVWRGVTVDVTKRKLSEAALLRAEKLAAMGRLASTVAHEINNPLEAVTNLLYLAHADPGLGDETRAYIATAETELARLGNITRLTLGFVRNNATVSNVEMSAVVDDVLSIFRHRLDTKNVTVERSYHPDVRVRIAPHELRQIATNLIANAVDAVASTGARIAIHICREDSIAVIQVEDNGVGIAAANLQRIFEPFFSTKEEVGTGIGLWVTRELVEKNGGRIFVHSRGPDAISSDDLPAGTTTRFRVELPLATL
jgi:PAS domain S-box-containing protein